MESAASYPALALNANKPLAKSEHAIDARSANQGPSGVFLLTRGLATGNETAYRTFHEEYVGRLSRYLLVAARGDEDAMREALQETMRRVVKHARVFSDEAVFWSWLTVLARSSLFDEKRKRHRYLTFLDRFWRQSEVDEQSSPHELNRIENHLQGLLARQVNLLSADDRDLVERKYFRGQRVREIALELELAEKAVESRLSRARLKLKMAMIAELKHESTG